jgi:hypothetical protein
LKSATAGALAGWTAGTGSPRAAPQTIRNARSIGESAFIFAYQLIRSVADDSDLQKNGKIFVSEFLTSMAIKLGK